MLKIGNKTVADMKLGSVQIERAYIGTELVWENTTTRAVIDADSDQINTTRTCEET